MKNKIKRIGAISSLVGMLGTGAASAQDGWKAFIEYFHGLGNNVDINKTTFDNSPTQKHNLSPNFRGISLGMEKEDISIPLWDGKKLKFDGGIGFVHGQASDKTTLDSYGTAGMSGQFTSRINSELNGIEAYFIPWKKSFGKLNLRAKLSGLWAKAESTLTGSGSVSGGGFSAEGTESASAEGNIVYLGVGLGANYNIGNWEIYGSAEIGSGNTISYNGANTSTTLNWPGGSMNLEGEVGDVDGDVAFDNIRATIGARYRF